MHEANDAVSREVSLFNFGQSTAGSEAISREISLFNFGQPTVSLEAISREVSLFNFGQPTIGIEAISREVSVYNRGSSMLEAVSREVSLFNFGQPTAGFEAISREISLFNHAYNVLSIEVGSTVLLAGSVGGVPVTFSTFAPVTNVQVAVDFPRGSLTNWSVQPLLTLTATAFVSNSSRLFLTFSPTNGQGILTTQQLGQITFTASSNQPSAFLPLSVADFMAPMRDGTTYTPYETVQDGEVVVLNKQSLERLWCGTNGDEYLTLYGFSGTNYTIESATNLDPVVVWEPVYTLTPSNFIAVTPALSMTNPAMFYRARQ